jgi:outer membrane protein OmpA-like peptidoglycan-associated protein
VTVSGKRIVIRGKVHFGSRNARLRPDSGQLLDEIADLLLSRPEIKRVRIEGHTDSRGSSSANKRLSQQRAEAVRTYLIERGVSSDRLEAVGYGASRPLVPNLGARNREKNRRVELRIVD